MTIFVGWGGRFSVIATVTLLLLGCGKSPEQIAETTKISLQSDFDTNPEHKDWHLTVNSVTVVKKSDNQYEGLAKVTHYGIVHDVPVMVTADSKNVLWKTGDGAFGFILEEKMRAAEVHATVIQELNSVDPIKTFVSEYFANTGEQPSCATLTGLACTPWVSVLHGNIVISLDGTQAPEVAGKKIVMVFSVNSNNDVFWKCTTDAEYDFVPLSCHFPIPVEVSGGLKAPAESKGSQQTTTPQTPTTPSVSAQAPVKTAEVAAMASPPSSTQPAVPAESNLTRGASISINVSGHSNPWDQSANPQMIYSAPNEAFPPTTVSLSKENIASGGTITLKCSSGSTNAGGVPDSGCDGLTQFEPANDRFQPACNTYYPSKYADNTTYPIFAMQILGVFAADSGVVVGKPFLISSKEYTVTVPVGATRLQLGVNDCKNSDNSLSPLVVELSRSGTSRVEQGTAQIEATSVTASASFDCTKASSVVEMLICSNRELSTADAELATFYKKNIVASGSNSAVVKQGQRAFISTRNQCSTVACVAEAYRARYEELGQLGYVRD